ncbi:zinc-binding metallopeptidase family protein [Lignipirellula cremea]|uniref:Zinc-ribbon domain-containing protein n=1 Tax=Lignipirellula cremea TaxID=2528010 RepID=A0A518DNS6_9BACT|nr:putative zinc-binding metallopeptidase [Lignipirellula cremea]QDU93492.1 hypothetical protein Pla8534_12720 [Lignipirellula cremea]
MKSYRCSCGNTLFFDSVRCVACGLDCGWCDECQTVSALVVGEPVVSEPVAGEPVATAAAGLRCANPDCGCEVRLCENRIDYAACNAYFSPSDEDIETEEGHCRSCRLTTDIPDLSIPGNLEHWKSLEAAKRRLLYQLNSLHLPYDAFDEAEPPLSFQFLADQPDEPFMTGHANGVIAINIKEAMPVEREASRLAFGELHRTLIGHFRHEVGHYFWMTLIAEKDYAAFVEVFGDDQDPPYSEAMPAYYDRDPGFEWAENYISRYASAHPWEDFAETSAFYLDMCGVLDTARYQMPQQFKKSPTNKESLLYDFDAMLDDYRRLGVIFNEVNRAMGLTDLLPEVVSKPVAEKLRYVHKIYGEPTAPLHRVKKRGRKAVARLSKSAAEKTAPINPPVAS